MNTGAHLILGAAAFAKPDAPRVTAAALLGAFVPDASLYIMVGWHLFVLGTSEQVVFRELYFSDAWMQIFRVDNSFVLWGLGLIAALVTKIPWAVAFCGAALLHLIFDFPLHHDDGRPHFWPITDWIYVSPVSYWDQNRYGNIVGPIEMILSIGLLAVLWQRFKGALARIAISIGLVLQLAPVVIWVFIFGS